MGKIKNKKSKNLEMRIYEALGIKIFRKLAYWSVFIVGLPFLIKMKPKELYKMVHTEPNNYNMKKGNGIQDLKDFKKWLIFNASIHTYGLINCLKNLVNIVFISTVPLSFGSVAFYLITTLINCYCLMLQRYNWIRINKAIQKYSKLDERKKSKIKEEIKNEDASIQNHTYKIINIFDEEKEITIDNLLDKASLEELKNIKELLKEYKETKDDYEDSFYEKEYHRKNISCSKRLILEINHN